MSRSMTDGSLGYSTHVTLLPVLATESSGCRGEKKRTLFGPVYDCEETQQEVKEHSCGVLHYRGDGERERT